MANKPSQVDTLTIKLYVHLNLSRFNGNYQKLSPTKPLSTCDNMPTLKYELNFQVWSWDPLF